MHLNWFLDLQIPGTFFPLCSRTAFLRVQPGLRDKSLFISFCVSFILPFAAPLISKLLNTTKPNQTKSKFWNNRENKKEMKKWQNHTFFSWIKRNHFGISFFCSIAFSLPFAVFNCVFGFNVLNLDELTFILRNDETTGNHSHGHGEYISLWLFSEMMINAP